MKVIKYIVIVNKFVYKKFEQLIINFYGICICIDYIKKMMCIRGKEKDAKKQ